MLELNSCRITKDQVFIGGVPLPDYIAVDGVVVKPAGHRDINRVTVTFLVGEVICEK